MEAAPKAKPMTARRSKGEGDDGLVSQAAEGAVRRAQGTCDAAFTDQAGAMDQGDHADRFAGQV
jgi:hypothetical protein